MGIALEPFRTYIDIMEHYTSSEEPKQVLTEADVVQEDTKSILAESLKEAVFKMRSYADSTGGEYSLGFESGLEMAAEMIENILHKIEGDQSGS